MKTKLGCLLQKYVLAMICLLFAPMTHAATPYAKGALLQIVSQMPEGTWQKVNVNSYSEAWTPAALRPLYGFGNPTPHKIIEAWSSFAWDSNRGDLILYGGGHANYSGNDVYRWRSRDLRWERASLPSEIELVPDSSAAYQAIDGAQNAPASAHTYDNAVFLPRSDRYLNFGGAVFNSGSFYAIRDGDPLATRRTGPYLFDPSKADPNKVGGTTGSHVQRVEPFPEIEGGRMWENRDIPKHLAGQPIPTSHVNGCTAYSPESDYDIVYVAARIGGGTGLYLYRYQITDINAPWLDQIERVGDYWSAPATQTSCGYDPASKVFLRLGNNSNPFYFWDLRPERQTNRDRAVATTGSVAEFVEWINSFTNSTGISLRQCSLDFDPNRGNFLLWCGSAEVWRISPPEQLSTSGWQVWREELGPGESPPLNVGIGILGKWKYVPGFDVFIGLENVVNGNIWVYKPIGWVPPETEDTGDGSNPEPDPDPVNQPPTVVLNSPATGETVAVNSLVTLSAQASDGDGTVMEVAFYVNGSAIGSATTEPYLADWIATEPGEYVLTAVAIDNMGASTTSEPV
ncbi:Ig-like domain-containing protein, partial [Nitrosomonas sp. ANs5]|uniref:Ig-like domain-containing protein n=1 Tax=Nitrosomonas sp. ANs5 TaxID=3423941 RepID=UPI003D33C0A1